MTCAACHGAEGFSVNLPGPNLAGQKDTYLVNALKAYRAGVRVNPTMGALAKGLSDSDISDVAAYFAGMSCKARANVTETTSAAGQALASGCAACHGANGVSVNPPWPNLAGQSKDYLLNALRAYRSGERKDAIMTGVVKTLNEVDAAAVAAYFAASPCK